MTVQQIKDIAASIAGELSSIRRHLHMHPELSMQEKNTASFIASKLRDYGIRHETGVAVHGIVGYIEGVNPTRQTYLLRADMDALPITEANDVEYCSTNPGVMHACGHDVHMTCLLGASYILQQLKSQFEGTVKILFQPSEEQFPGGATMMISEGVLNNPEPQYMFGQHVLPQLKAGKVGFKPGKYMASTDEIYISVKGRGGHAATPEMNVDPVLIGAHILVALQQIISRNVSPVLPAVLSFGRFIADGRTNIIPDKVELAGTLRTFDEEWRMDAHKKITSMAMHIAEGMGATCDVFIDKGYPFLVNDDALTLKAKNLAIEYLGAENVEDLEMRLTAEDFAYYSQRVPACFYRLGIRDESRGIVHNLHTPRFDVDELSLETGAGLMAWLAFASMK